MKIPAFNAEKLEGRLLKLSNEHQLLFGVLCCERLLPNYMAFQREVGSVGFDELRSALDLVWQILEQERPAKEDLEAAISACESVAPNSDDFSSLYVTAAQDACFAVCCLLDFLLEADVKKIVQAATYATDSVDLYVQEIERYDPRDALLEQKILSHGLMQKELENQEIDLQKIEAATIDNQNIIRSLRQTRSFLEKGNLDV
jgi:uncharacterized protein YjaG (DUF416 family)